MAERVALALRIPSSVSALVGSFSYSFHVKGYSESL